MRHNVYLHGQRAQSTSSHTFFTPHKSLLVAQSFVRLISCVRSHRLPLRWHDKTHSDMMMISCDDQKRIRQTIIGLAEEKREMAISPVFPLHSPLALTAVGERLVTSKTTAECRNDFFSVLSSFCRPVIGWIENCGNVVKCKHNYFHFPCRIIASDRWCTYWLFPISFIALLFMRRTSLTISILRPCEIIIIIQWCKRRGERCEENILVTWSFGSTEKIENSWIISRRLRNQLDCDRILRMKIEVSEASPMED